MSRTLTAMFDDRSEAERARQQLQAMGATAEIRDQSHLSSGTYDDSNGAAGGLTDDQRYSDSRSISSSSDGGFWSDLKSAFVSDEDRHSYEEGVRRGGVLLTAHVEENRADEACQLLERAGSVDFDSREQSWRQEGWQGYQGRQQQDFAGQSQQQGMRQEEHIPIVEEQLRVGKREVERGGARVRSYVEETPVHESVNLREEHVNIERRPVDQPLDRANPGGDVFQERTVEMRETAEEAVVAKEARVKEELVVSKFATERTEEIDETVRHTEVDVDNRVDSDRTSGGGGGENRNRDPNAFGFDKR